MRIMNMETRSTLIPTSSNHHQSSSNNNKRGPKKSSQQQERKVFWTPLATSLAVMMLFCVRALPENFSLTSIGEFIVQVRKVISSASQAKAIPAVVSQPFDDLWPEPRSSLELFDNSTKIIWAYWDKGLDGMPPLCQHAVESWKVRNPNWRVIILDDYNYQDYVSVSDLPTTFFSLKVQHRSDLLRLAVLIRYGGLYLDASTLVFKSFDGIWDTVEDDKLMLTSLNKLPESGLDLFNNGLLMTKGTHNPVLKLWQQRILKYSEAPSLTLEEMKKNPVFSRVADDWNDPSLGILADMVPYHSNLWMLDDLIWNNDENAAQHVLHLPKLRWGFWFLSFPHLITESRRQRKINPDSDCLAFDPSHDPEMISWKPLPLLNAVTTILPLVFQDDRDLAFRMVENSVALKFTSHDLGLIELGIRKFGLEHTLGYIYHAATNTTMYPIQQATLAGAETPLTVAKTTPAVLQRR